MAKFPQSVGKIEKKMLKKSALILGKNILIRFICRFNFSFKMLFWAYPGKKIPKNFSLRGLLLVCCRLNLYRSAPIFRKLPCPEKFLVTRLCQIYILRKKGIIFGGNASYNEDFRSTILQPFQFEPDQETTCVNESHEKGTTAAVVRRYSSN